MMTDLVARDFMSVTSVFPYDVHSLTVFGQNFTVPFGGCGISSSPSVLSGVLMHERPDIGAHIYMSVR